MTSATIRSAFCDYFTRHGHTPVASSPVVPHNDPTLLFANAGMNQFKHVFVGLETRPYTRATSCQKCIRAGGKHNDLDNVGKTPRHHTLFEMLGNFSFGDYFKEDAIAFAWEVITKVYGLPPQHLWMSVFEEDDEAEALWKKFMPASRIVRLGKKDNFWEMGDTGPCGPCSEISLDVRSFFGTAKPDRLTYDDNRCLELWNLVFMQFNRHEDGSMEPLPRPSVDTGAGLERIASILQGKHSNYETDVFSGLIEQVAQRAGVPYTPLELLGARPMTEAETEAGMPHRVIADHIRALAFAIGDGAVPSNEGRGYVLRRILRRAARYGRKLGITEPFLTSLLPTLARQMSAVYPTLQERLPHITQLIRQEEERFASTLVTGIELFNTVVAKGGSQHCVSGADAFRLYDTYGFPLDATQDMAREIGWQVDVAGFETSLAAQRQRAKAARAVTGPRLQKAYDEIYQQQGDTRFVGYEQLACAARVVALVNQDGERCAGVSAPAQAWMVVDTTPLYGASGGQEGDRGTCQRGAVCYQITECARPTHNVIAHLVDVSEGELREGDAVQLATDADWRHATMRHHTATHLLHAALHQVLGKHATQAGSAVNPERLRFDFQHHAGVSVEEKDLIEELVNTAIQKDLPVETTVTTMAAAQAAGAMMLFDEKYGAHVRMVTIGDVSRELCGGTHVPRTGWLGAFQIVGESAVAAGVRRIEAVCGMPAVRQMQRQRALLRAAAQYLNVKDDELVARIEKLQDEIKTLTKKARDARSAGAPDLVGTALASKRAWGAATLIVADLGEIEAPVLLAVSDQLRATFERYIIVLAARVGEKCSFIVQLSDDQVQAGRHAGTLVKELAKLTGGGGGGKPHAAQAGGKQPEKIGEALAAVERLLGGVI
jgi:alanyl-tRNA synthetase